MTDVVYVLSREYTFFFDKNQELGMIAPIWADEYPAQPGWTTFRLKLTSKDNIQRMTSHLEQIHPSLLLFLRRLKQIEIKSTNRNVTFSRTEDGDDIILTSASDPSSHSERYLVVKHRLATHSEEPKRFGVAESELVLAFPLTMDGQPIVQDQPVYAFLPLRNYGFKVCSMHIIFHCVSVLTCFSSSFKATFLRHPVGRTS